MSEDVKKAICLCVFTWMLAGAWCFDSYLGYKEVFTQEQTKRLISLDNKKLELERLKQDNQAATASYWPKDTPGSKE